MTAPSVAPSGLTYFLATDPGAAALRACAWLPSATASRFVAAQFEESNWGTAKVAMGYTEGVGEFEPRVHTLGQEQNPLLETPQVLANAFSVREFWNSPTLSQGRNPGLKFANTLRCID